MKGIDKLEPLYIHDCTDCKFIAVYNATDIYVCNNSFLSTQIIIRNSDNPTDSTSLSIDVAESLSESPQHQTFFNNILTKELLEKCKEVANTL